MRRLLAALLLVVSVASPVAASPTPIWTSLSASPLANGDLGIVVTRSGGTSAEASRIYVRWWCPGTMATIAVKWRDSKRTIGDVTVRSELVATCSTWSAFAYDGPGWSDGEQPLSDVIGTATT